MRGLRLQIEEDGASKMLHTEVSQNSRKLLNVALLIIAGVFFLRLFTIRDLPLTGDEAYYWQWGRHLSLGYHDHPPLVGWLIAATSLAGHASIWVRISSLILASLSSLFLFLFTKAQWHDDKKGLLTLLLFSFIPIFAVCSLAIFPDAPLAFSWAFFLWASWNWLENENYWPLMGIALGLATLSKLMGLFLFPSLLLFCLNAKTDSSLLKRASLWKSFILAFLIISPMLYWNWNHHFETLLYQVHQRITRGSTFSPGLFLNYVSLQIVSLSPLVFFIFLAIFKTLFSRAQRGDVRSIFALSMALPIHIFFLIASFFTRVGLHWALPGDLSVIASLPLWLHEMETGNKRWASKFFMLTLASVMIFTLFLFTLLRAPEFFIPKIASLGIQYGGINHGKKLSNQAIAEILGYQELGEHIQKTPLLHQPGNFVLADSYSLSSVISFYANVDTKTILFTSTGGEYDRWNHFENAHSSDALYVDTEPIGSRADINRILGQAFKKVIPLPPLSVHRAGVEVATFYFAHCFDLQDPSALRPTKPW